MLDVLQLMHLWANVTIANRGHGVAAEVERAQVNAVGRVSRNNTLAGALEETSSINVLLSYLQLCQFAG